MNYPTNAVQYGQTSADVKTLQNFLISQGYSIPAGATGYFGDQTKSALSQWQSANGIPSSTAGYGTNWGPKSIAAVQGQQGGQNNQNNQVNPNQAQIDALNQQLQQLQGQVGYAQSAGYGDTGQYAGQDIPESVLSGTVDPIDAAVQKLRNKGFPEIADVMIELQKIKKTQEAAGMKVNPNIALTPAELQGFYDQASTQINPYYQSQFSAIKGDLGKNLTYLQKQYDLQKQSDEATFKSNLATSRENAAGTGMVNSGFRGQNEQNQISAQGRSLESNALSLENQMQGGISTAERNIGSENLSGLQTPSFQSYTASTTGQGGFTPGRTLNFGLTGGVTGSSQYQQRQDIFNLQSHLASEESANRALKYK